MSRRTYHAAYYWQNVERRRAQRVASKNGQPSPKLEKRRGRRPKPESVVVPLNWPAPKVKS